MKEKTLFERLDDLSATQAELLDAITGVGQKADSNDARIADLERQLKGLKRQNQATPVQKQKAPLQKVYTVTIKEPAPKQTTSKEPALKTFARTATKSWRWFGSKKEFKRAKFFSILISLFMVTLAIAAPILTIFSLRSVSPFSLVECIWVIFSAIYLANACVAPIKYEVNEFAKGTTLKVIRDDVDMVYPNGGEKLIYGIFRVITLVMIPLNIGWIWLFKSDISWIVTIVEVVYFCTIMAAWFVNLWFMSGYYICWLDGENLTTGEDVTLIKMPGSNTFVLEKDLRQQCPQLFE